jgi:hypothetical protein
VKALNVDRVLIDRKANVTKTVVTSTLSETETKISTVLDLSIPLIRPNL